MKKDQIPYATATSGERALQELQKTLRKFGCQSFGTMIDAEKGETIVQFRWCNREVSLRASWKGYAAALIKAKPYTYKTRGTRQEYDAKMLAQAQLSVCSVLRDWIKGQVTAVECGMMSFEAAFMSHILLANGERVIDRVQSQGMLPQLENDNVIGLRKIVEN